MERYVVGRKKLGLLMWWEDCYPHSTSSRKKFAGGE